MKTILFNSSLPRSGSELLQVLLHQNPEIYASPTSPLLEFQFGARRNLGLPEAQAQPKELMDTAFNKMCGEMAQGYYGAITDRPIVIDKNRGWAHYYEWVNEWNEDPKMICMIRDPRSIVGSLERKYRENRHRPAGPDDPTNLHGMTVAGRAQHWLSTQPLGLALQRTADTFQRGLDEKIAFVKYESLCNSPKTTMEKVYKHIGLPAFQHDFKNIEKEVEENTDLFGVYGNHDVMPKLTPAKSEDWADVLPEDVAAGIRQSHAWFYEAFKY